MPKQQKQQQQTSQNIYVRAEKPAGSGDDVLLPGIDCAILTEPKVFKSGKPGWWGQARWTIGGAKYMVQLQIVKINGE